MHFYQKSRLINPKHKWEFNVEGNPLAIEDPANYEKRKKTDRLNNDILENYMKRLGFDCTQKGFWVSAGNAIEYKFELGTD